jgi:hypothetical protein
MFEATVRHMPLNAGEVDAGEVWAPEGGVADRRARPVDEVDDAVGQASLLQQAHQVVRGEHRRSRRLPDDDVAHQRGRGRQVGGDRGEVERRDREDEALERPVLHPVPDPLRRLGLLRVEARHELDVEAEEVDRFARRVDLGLVRRLRLPEHRRRVERVAPRPRQELGGAEQNRGAILPRPPRPVLPRRGGRVDRLPDVLGPALVDVGEDVVLRMRHDGGLQLARGDVLAADHERDLDPFASHLLEAALQAKALGRAGREIVDGLVPRGRRPEDRMGAHGSVD